MPIRIQCDNCDADIEWQLCRQRRLRQHDCRVGIFLDETHPLLRIVRVQRHIGTTRLVHRDHADHHLDRALGINRHQSIRGYAQTAQVSRQLVGSCIKLTVCEPCFTKLQSHRIRRPVDLGLEQLMHSRIQHIVTSGRVPIRQQLVTFGRCQQVQPVNAGVRGSGR